MVQEKLSLKKHTLETFPNILLRTRQGKWELLTHFQTCDLGSPLRTHAQRVRELFTQELEHLGRICKEHAVDKRKKAWAVAMEDLSL